MWRHKLVLVTLLVSLTLVALTGSACAKEAAAPAVFTPPDKVTVICAYSMGGFGDTSFRGVQPYFQKHSGATTILENRPGTGGILALNYVYSLPADGRTVVYCGTSILLRPETYSVKTAFDPKTIMEAFIPVVLVTEPAAEVLVTRADSPIKTMDDLIAAAKERTINAGVTSIGGTTHRVMLGIEKTANIKFNPIPYSGGGEVRAALLGGDVELTTDTLDRVVADPGSVNIIAIDYMRKVPQFPNVPLLSELGYPGAASSNYYPILIKEGTSEEMISWWEEGFRKATQDPGLKAWAERVAVPITFGDRVQARDTMETFYQDHILMIPEIKAALEAAQN